MTDSKHHNVTPSPSDDLLCCSRCGEEAITVCLPDGTWFVRVRRMGKCKNYAKSRAGTAEICKTFGVYQTESFAIKNWNDSFAT